MAGPLQIAVFGGGCFWCTEAVFKLLRGVVSVIPGYAGGRLDNPSYEQVSGGSTGHAEVIRVEFDPVQISFRDLLEVFFATHDPTTMNRQGHDVGEQYRSVILYASDDQQNQALDFIHELEKEEVFDDPIVTQVRPLEKFYEAEDYHKDYYQNNSSAPYCQVVINPKLEKLKKKFTALLKA